MFFSFTKDNGTGRGTLSLDIVNFREVILMTELLSREVCLGDSRYLRFPCLYNLVPRAFPLKNGWDGKR